MPGTYAPQLVGLSIAVAILASFVALELAARVAASRGGIRRAWLFAGASAMGIGIWSMHFTGMLAFHLPVPVFYDVTGVLLSLLAAIAASTAAFSFIVRPKVDRSSLAVAAVIMGAAIGTMHYSGVAAMHLDASMSYRVSLVALSLVIALLVGYAALWLTVYFRGENPRSGQWHRGLAALFMGLAIAGMHYTAMAALRFGAPNEQFVMPRHAVVAAPQLAPVIVGASLLLLGSVLVVALIDRQLRFKTRLIEAQLAAREEERLRAFYDAMTCGVIVRGASGALTYANRAALRLLPLVRNEIATGHAAPDTSLRDANGRPLDGAGYPSEIARRTAQPVTGAIVATRDEDGQERWLLCDAVPFIDRDTGSVDDVIVSLVDVTERRRIEQSLRESEERFRTMVDSLADGIVLQLADFSIAACNESAVRITGLTADQMLGRLPRPEGWLAIREDGTPFDLRQHPSILTLLTGQAASCMMGVQCSGKETTWISINTRPLFNAGSTTAYAALSSIIDVSDRVRAQAAERTAREAAEAANRAKSDFLANMSHEIRTPMNGVLGMLGLVLGTTLEPTQRQYLEVAEASADALLDVINEILDFSKVEAGRMELRPEPFALADCLAAAVDPLAPRAAQKRIELAVRIAPGMPPILVGDPVRLRQLLTNLVGNAVKFTERGEIVVTVDSESTEHQQVVLQFAVRDTGIGIPADKQALIFDAFTQVDGSATRAYAGTGLGLAISTRLAALMGGRLWVESTEGEGSTFHFTATFATHAEPLPIAEETSIEELRGMRVLIVDDNGTNRLILHEMLTSWEMRPVAVHSGAAALAEMEKAAVARTPYRIVLVDGLMPEMDGFTLVEKLRESARFAGASVLMLTSADGDGAADRCKALGVAAHLLKPVKSRELRAALARALGRPLDSRVPEPTADRLDARSAYPSRLLLAEDNLVNQKLAIAILERWGHRVEVVSDGRAALAAVSREQFAAVLMDVQMPTMDGLRATMEIRATEAHRSDHLPIIAMTARTMTGDREKCLEAGMDAYVSKPFDVEELFGVLESVLEGRREALSLGSPRRPGGSDVVDAAGLINAVAGDRSLLGELLDIFRTEGPRQLAALREALARGDAAGVESVAHSLKGSVGSLKAKRSHDAAQNVEMLARRGALTEIPPAYAVLEEEIARLEQALTTFAEAA